MQPWNRAAVVQVLRDCGEIALRYYDRPRIELKQDRSIVTQADQAVEEYLARLYDRPAEGSYLIGEETVAARSEEYLQEALRGQAWVVDPIDGTAPYAHRIPTWAVSIGYLHRGELEEGAVYLPITREVLISQGSRVYYGTLREAGPAETAWEDVTALPGRPVHFVPSGLIGITQGMTKRGRLEVYNPVQALCSAVMSLAFLCLGRYLGYVGKLNLWDLAGGLPLLLKCGLQTRLHGGPPIGPQVTPEVYDLQPGSPRRWKLRGVGVFALSEEIADRLDRLIDEA